MSIFNGKKFVCRQDIARALEISTDSVARNEHRLGLDQARCDVNTRLVRYDAAVTQQQLVKAGAILEKP